MRYSVIVMFPLTLLLAYALQSLPTKLCRCFVVGLLLIQLLNINGMLLPRLSRFEAVDPSQMERSREFLKAIAMDRRLARELEENFPNTILVCKCPYPQMLTMPQLRYVSRPLQGVRSYGFYFARYAPAPEVKQKTLNDPNTWYLYAANSMDICAQPSFYPKPSSKLHYVDFIDAKRPGVIISSGIKLLPNEKNK